MQYGHYVVTATATAIRSLYLTGLASAATAALPPDVFTRWMKVVLAKMPGPSGLFASSRSHGMALGSTVTAFGGKAPTTVLPLLLCHVGPPKWIATMPLALNRTASGTAVPQLVPFHV